MNSLWIDIDSRHGGTLQGDLSLPPTAPGLRPVREIFGVNEHMRGALL